MFKFIGSKTTCLDDLFKRKVVYLIVFIFFVYIWAVAVCCPNGQFKNCPNAPYGRGYIWADKKYIYNGNVYFSIPFRF